MTAVAIGSMDALYWSLVIVFLLSTMRAKQVF